MTALPARDETPQPAWPERTYATREEAIAAAMAELEPGDTTTIHQEDCNVRLELDCSCEAEVRVVPSEARA